MLGLKEFADFINLHISDLTATYTQLLKEKDAGYENLSTKSHQVAARKLIKAVVASFKTETSEPLCLLFDTSTDNASCRWIEDITAPQPMLEIESLGQTLTPVVPNLEAGKFLWQILSEVRTVILSSVEIPLTIDPVGETQKQISEEFEKSYQSQLVLNEILQISLEEISVEEQLERILDVLLATPWLPSLPKGAIFLVDNNDPNILVLKAQSNLDKPLLTMCALVPFGHCLCGRAATTGKIQFADCVDDRHENSYDGISPHGHYNVPIMSDNKVLGVIVLYLNEGHIRDDYEEAFLEVVANTLTGLIKHKQVQTSLEQSEEQTRLIIDTAIDAVITINPDNIITNWNSQAEKTFGWSYQEVVGQPLVDMIIPVQYRDVHKRGVRKFLNTGAAPVLNKLIEITALHRDGHEFPIELSISLIKLGDRITFSAFIRDITKRKALEQQVQTSLERSIKQVHASTEVAQKIAAASSLDNMFERVVNLIKEQFGYYYTHVYTLEKSEKDRQDSFFLVMQEGTGEVGRILKERGHKINYNAKKSLVVRAARSGKPALVEDVHQDKTWLPNSLLPDTKSELAVPIKLRDKLLGVLDVQANEVGGLDIEDQILLIGLCGQIAVAIDNHRATLERKKTETELLKLSHVVEQSPNLVVITDTRGVIEYINPMFTKVTGYTPEEAIGKNPRILKSGEVSFEGYRELWKTVLDGKEWQGELHNKKKNGELYWAFATISPVKDSEGVITHLIGVQENITERKKTLEILETLAIERAALNDVGLAILKENDPLSVYTIVANSLVDNFNISFTQIWILDKVVNELVLQVNAGDDTHLDKSDNPISLDSDHKLAWIANQRKPHITNDLFNDSLIDMGEKKWAKETNTVAFAGYPLFAGDDLLGVLGMFSHKPILAETQPILQSLAVIIGTVINSQRFYDQTQRRIYREQTIREITDKMREAVSLEELVKTAAIELGERLSAGHAVVELGVQPSTSQTNGGGEQ